MKRFKETKFQIYFREVELDVTKMSLRRRIFVITSPTNFDETTRSQIGRNLRINFDETTTSQIGRTLRINFDETETSSRELTILHQF